jgi:two-component system, OmpR family, heavy metal sensor histidine kinase CusS
VLTDVVKLEHVLLNLIENAVKYAVAGTVVTVELIALSGWEIRIQNRTMQATGPTPELIQAYFRADPFKAGHGLGLWISHRLTTLLGGTLLLDWQDFTFTSTVGVKERIAKE